MDKLDKELIVVVYYILGKLDYSLITPDTSINNISPNLARLMDVYIRYFTQVNQKLTQLATSEP